MINVYNRKECFFDNFLLDEDNTTAEKRLHKPVRRGTILEMNMPWESERVTMFSVLFAEGKWRMYYVDEPKKLVCYAESDDAENWVRPSLGIVEYNGSYDNNIILSKEMFIEKFDFSTFDNMSVFYDDNPACPPSERYKMVAMWLGHASLCVLTSADGISFDSCRKVTDDGEFDSQNRMFWSTAHSKYFAYFHP